MPKEGEARVWPHNGSGLTPLERDCPGCHAVGRIDIRTVELQRCTECFGTGRDPPPCGQTPV